MNAKAWKSAWSGKNLLAAMLAILLAIGGLFTLGVQLAHADSTYLEVGDQIPYGGYSTGRYTADGQMAYCANPSMASPESGDYEKASVDSAGWYNSHVCHAIYYGYGGPGFDEGVEAGMWPDTWYDGEAMSSDNYAALTHIILADMYASDYAAATYGCSQAFLDYLSDYVLIYDWRTGENSHFDNTEYKMVLADMPSDFMDYCFQLDTGSSTQIILGHSWYEKNGGLDVVKVSADTSMTEGNENYSYEGAVFELRDSSGNTVAQVTTDADGKASFTGIAAGAYTLVETEAPPGYEVADNQEVEVSAGQTATITVADSPEMGGLAVAKYDKRTGTWGPEGDATLEGAEFSITDEAGKAVATISTELVDGKYIAQTAADALPYGTYTVKETKAPKGYTLNDSWSGTADITPDTPFVNLTSKSSAAGDAPVTGGLIVAKVDADTGEIAQGDATLKGAVFSITNASAASVEVGGEEYDSGEVVATIKTKYDDDYDAYVAKTAVHVLPYGTYTLKETVAPEGYELNESWSKTVKVTEDGALAGYGQEGYTDAKFTVGNTVERYGLAVAKYDVDTEESGPQGDAEMAGAQFAVINSSSEAVEVDGATYEVGSVVMTITAEWDEEHEAYVAKTAADALPYGTYTLKETAAPEGYLDNESWSLTVSPYEDVDPGEIAYYAEYEESVADRVMRGNLSVVKVDDETTVEQGDAVRSGAVYDVINNGAHAVLSPQYETEVKPGGVVCQIVTDADGEASTTNAKLNGWSIPSDWEGKALAYGSYLVKESTPPTGYEANDEWVGEAEISEDETDPQVELTAPDPVERYGLAVAKYDVDTEESNPQGDAEMAGAQFAVINSSANPVMVNETTYAAGSVVMTIAAEWDDGYEAYVAKTAADALPYGTYTLKETAAPEGYLINEDWTLTVSPYEDAEPGEIADYTVYDTAVTDRVQRGNIELEKDDSQRASGEEQGDASLAGAVYDIINESENAVLSPQYGSQVEPGGVVCQIVTGEDGKASTTYEDLNGWSIPSDWEGKALPFGTYRVVESTASTGYNLNTAWEGVSVISEDGQVSSLQTTEDIERGGVKVGKVSRENGAYHEQGAASLEEWAFEVVNMSAEPVILGRDGTTEIAPGQVVTTITTKLVDGAYIAQTADDALPYGTYEIHEIQTMRPQDNGYLFDDESEAWSQTFTIRSEGEVADFTDEEDAEANQVVRGDFAFNKRSAETMRPLANIPFKVTSVTTGEWHIVMTDDNGEADTSSDNYAHSYKTNANDEALGEDGTVDESKLDYEAGVWFSGSTTMEVPVDDSRGALVFDTYTFEELRCEGNEGYSLVTFEQRISRDGKVVDLGTVDDSKSIGPQISTTLQDAEGGKVVAARSDAQLVDAVTFNNLEVGETYKLVAQLYKVADGELGDQLSENEVEFAPATTHGVEEVELELDTSDLEGCSLVCFEYLYDADGSLVATHEDATDEGQTVSVPQIATELTDAATGSHHAAFEEPGVVELTDTVTYEGLTPRKTYTVKGTLMNKESGEAVVDADGDEVTAERTFTPTEPSGVVELTFTFKDPGLAGSAIVAYESLEYRGVEYAVHADIDDEDQTVYVPAISTTFEDEPTGSHVTPAAGTAKLVDTVAYENVEPGCTYSLQATLMDQSTGREVVDAEGNALTVTVEFTPESSSGTVDVPIEVDVGVLPVATVCFEKLFAADNVLAASHEDLADEGQTVYVPSISTTFTEASTGYHSITAQDEVELVDTVAYEGLEPGCEYTMTASLVDGESGDGLEDSAGTRINAQVSFTPEERDGSIEVPFMVSAADLASATVCFEQLYDAAGTLMASHEDLTDEGQTLYVPAIATTATDARTESHIAALSSRLYLLDAVAYEGLEPGVEYTLSGTVHVRDEDGSDAGVLTDTSGAEVSAEATLIPEERDGEATVSFKADVDDLAGAALVVFERLVVTETGVVVASHEDITDEGQTVYAPAISTTAVDGDSGTHYAASTGTVELVDTVSYENLVPGIGYTMSGELRGKADDGSDAGPVYDAEGNAVTASQEFTPESASGTVAVTFEFDPQLASGEVVVFENLTVSVADGEDADGNEVTREQTVAEHADITDEGQTVQVASIATTATDSRTGAHVAVSSDDVELVDVVAYEGLEPGAQYRLAGAVHVRDASGADAGALKDASGNDVTAELGFKPEESEGSVQITFDVTADVEPGTALVVFESLTDGEGREVASHADISDEGQTVSVPALATTATEAESGGHYASALEPFTVVDEVVYEGLVPNLHYTMQGSLHAVSEAGEDLGIVEDGEGDAVTASVVFTPESASGTVSLEFEVDPAWMPARAVAFEKCGLMVDGEVVPVAEHEDADDEDQTVRTAKIGTTLIEAATGSHVLSRIGENELVDTVAYEGLEAGRAYALSAALVSGYDGTAVKDSNGNAYETTVEFTPEKPNGTVEVPFEVVSADLPATTVCFERLSKVDNTLVATHEDLSDDGQTVIVPQIGTTAVDARTGGHTGALASGIALKDSVAYENLEVGTEYTIAGTVHVRGADGEDAGTLEDAKGNAVTAEKTFTPEEESGTVELSFSAKVEVSDGALVVFEELINEETGTVAARHADIADEGQTVSYPAIATTLVEKETSSHYAGSAEKFTVVDTVAYSNLVPGQAYVMSGTLHAVDENGEDQGPVEDGEGNELTCAETFTPKSSTGSVEVAFEVDPAWITNKIVAFETCGVMVNGVFTPVATHEDVDDESQTVRVAKISTQARDGETGGNVGHAGASATIIDVVSYEGLEPNCLYTLSGKLMDKGSGKPFTVEGREVTTTSKLIPDSSSGEVEIEFEVEGALPSGTDLVVFERLYADDGKVVVTHEDIDNEAQTVCYRAPGADTVLKRVGDTFDKTGYWLARYWWILAIAGTALLLLGAIRYMDKDGGSPFNREDKPTKR